MNLEEQTQEESTSSQNKTECCRKDIGNLILTNILNVISYVKRENFTF